MRLISLFLTLIRSKMGTTKFIPIFILLIVPSVFTQCLPCPDRLNHDGTPCKGTVKSSKIKLLAILIKDLLILIRQIRAGAVILAHSHHHVTMLKTQVIAQPVALTVMVARCLL